MPDMENPQLVGSLLAPELGELIDRRQTFEVRSLLLDLMDPEIADVLMALGPAQRAFAFRLLPRDRAAVVFTFLPPATQELLLGELNNEQLAALFDEMAPDDRAMLFDEMPGQVAAKLLALIRPEERRKTQIILGYPADSIGRLMTSDYLAIRSEWTVQQVLDHIRKNGRDAETLSWVYVVDERGRLLDDIRLRQLLLVDPASPVKSLMDEQFVALHAQDDREKAVRMMHRYDFSAMPVVDRDEILVGIVTFDDVADVDQEETTEEIQKMGGVEALDEPYITMPIWRLAKKRGTWLSVLFLGEMLTATAMGFFEHEIERAAVLALFLPLIISSGGNSGSQGSTLIIRAMALHEITLKDWFRVFRRELACGLLLGILLGTLGLVRIHLWQAVGWQDYTVRERVGNTFNVAPDAKISIDGQPIPFHATGPVHISLRQGTGEGELDRGKDVHSIELVSVKDRRIFEKPLASYHLMALTVGLSLIGVVVWGTMMGSMLPFVLRALKLDPAAISAPLVATLVDVTGLVIYFTTAMFILHAIFR
jgi:magnesium transporter